MQPFCSWKQDIDDSTPWNSVLQIVNETRPPLPNPSQCITVSKTDDTRCELTIVATSGGDDDEEEVLSWNSITVHSSSRIVEVYTDEKEYLCTMKFKQKLSAGQYICAYSVESPVVCSRIVLKFLSLDHVTAKQQKNDIHNIIIVGRMKQKEKRPVMDTSGLVNELMRNPSLLMGMMNGTSPQLTTQISQQRPPLESILQKLQNQHISTPVHETHTTQPDPLPQKQVTETLSENSIPSMDLIMQQIKEYMHSDEMKRQVTDWIDERMSHWEQRILSKVQETQMQQSDKV